MADLSITPASVQHATGASLKQKTAGEDIDAGDPIYIDSATNTAKQADANGGSAAAAAAGIAAGSAKTGQPLWYVSEGDIDLGVTLVVGETYILSPDKGISPVGDAANPDRITHLGVGKTASLLKVKIHASDVVRA